MVVDWIALGFLALGVVFGVMGNLGVLVFPDVYTRLQASSTASTTSVLSVFVAMMVISGFTQMTGKIAVITVFFLVTSPIAAHIIGRFAWEAGVNPWRRSYQERQRLREEDDDG
ncbi:MAG: monovalent cation/H(+) antiporter subunit G [Spirochaeta sp.]|jgi:multicomponent Na+:H+ antiporter subunit G|nr:monovalent cation/H(+) antiporter subunit G [Spirochaeta sp.]